MRGRRRVHPLRRVATMASMAIVVVLAPTSDLGAASSVSFAVTATCDFDASTGVVTVDNPDGGVVFIQRRRQRIDVHKVECVDGGTVAKIDNVDVININGSAGNDTVILRVREGPLGPGRTHAG